LKKQLKLMHDGALDASDRHKGLVLYRRVGQYELEKQIGLLAQAVRDLQVPQEQPRAATPIAMPWVSVY